MRPEIKFSRSPGQSDEFELSISVSDGTSLVHAEMYTTTARIKDFRDELAQFSKTSGTRDFQFGRFGPEYAGGSMSIRFHIKNNCLYLTTECESRFKDFGNYSVANRAKIHVFSDPNALEIFVLELDEFSCFLRCEACLALSL